MTKDLFRRLEHLEESVKPDYWQQYRESVKEFASVCGDTVPPGLSNEQTRNLFDLIVCDMGDQFGKGDCITDYWQGFPRPLTREEIEFLRGLFAEARGWTA